MTPEGKVKKAIKDVLDPLKPRVWYDMPVPGGFGKSVLDFVGAAYGHPFAIEAKAVDGGLTERQKATIRALEQAGVQCFVIGKVGGSTLHELDLWLKAARLQDRTHEVALISRAWVTDVIIDETAEVDPEVYRKMLEKLHPKKSLSE